VWKDQVLDGPNLSWGNPPPTGEGGGLSDATMIMMIMCVLVEELLHQGMTGWIPVLNCLFIRCAWVPVATSCQARPNMALFPKDLATVVLTRYWRAPVRDRRGPVLCWVTRRIHSGQPGDKIPPVRDYCDGREDRYGSFLSLVLFRFAAPLLQPGVVGPYLAWGTLFPSHLPLEGTSHIQIFEP
jgi:hypothetical protein